MGTLIKTILIGVAWAAIVIYGGVFFFNSASKPYAEKQLNTELWQQTKAHIIRSGIDTLVTEEGKNRYSHHFVYSYQINGKEYNGTKIKNSSTFHRSNTSHFILKKMEKYKLDTDIAIFYNSEEPKESYIEPPSVIINLLIKYLPLILTIPIGLLVILSQIKVVLTSFKNEY